MSEVDTEVLTVQDELASLKARADLLGVKYHPSISVEKLREKVSAVMSDKPAATEPALAAVPATVTEAPPETDNQRRARRRKEASRLVRIRVSCMNPAKKEWEGEIFTAGNSVVGSVTKYIPFNVEDGWHVPHIIYEQVIQRQCQIFTTTRDSRGNTTRKGKLIKEFSVEVMPQLTAEELAELARRQAMSKAID